MAVPLLPVFPRNIIVRRTLRLHLLIIGLWVLSLRVVASFSLNLYSLLVE
jgi:hypothetical protein